MSDIKSIKDALAVLESAAASGDQDLHNVLVNDYNNLKKAVFKSAPETAWNSMKHAKDVAVDYTVEKARVIDRSVHDHPWSYIGGAALIAGLVGFLVGRSSK